MPRPILIAGPTASGKSALALGLAERLGGVIVNADSQQVYADWRLLSARPAEADLARAPHVLFGHLPLDADYSTGAWTREAMAAIADAQAQGLRPILVGGTGLYFTALTQGLAPIPPVPPLMRAEAEAELQRLGLTRFAAELARRDPATAAVTDLANPMRLLRAWEVLEATGQGLAAWHATTGAPLLPLDQVVALVLTPDRAWLYQRCEARFDAMLAGGVLDEVRAVMARNYPPAAPGLKAVGAPDLMAYLRGEITLEQAAQEAKTATRRYAKRQLTWARNQLFQWHALESHNLAQNLALATDLIEKAG